MLDLTLEQAVMLALEKNLELKAARMDPQLVDFQLQGARASFMPNVTSRYSLSNSTSPSNNILEGVTSLTNIGQTYNGGMSQTLPWFGSSYSVSFNNSRQSTNNVTTRLNPSYSSNLGLSFQMPLLAGFKIDGTRNNLRTLEITRQISDVNLLTQVENLRNSVRTSYWSLRSAIEQIEIAKRALDLAKQSYDQSKLRVEIGTAAPIDTTQFETALFNAEQSLLAAQIGWRTAELNFKRLFVTGADDEIYTATINPIDQPALSVASVDIQAAVTKALAERTDLIVARRNIESSQLNLEVTKNQTKPSLAFSTGYTLSGQGGTAVVTNGPGCSTSAPCITPGGYSDALKALSSFDTPAWNMGFNLTYPLGMRSARANYGRALLQMDQTAVRLKASELNVRNEVVNAGLNVENTYKLYQASQKSRQAAERNADAAQTRFDVGMATNFEVVQLQNQLTNARLTELGRLISYMNAVAEFDRVQRVGR
jgi:outer membrane protein TolC